MTYVLSTGETDCSLVWEQQIKGTAFAKSVRRSLETFSVNPIEGEALVTLSIDRRLKGSSRLGAPLVARAQRRELLEAIDSLEARLVR